MWGLECAGLGLYWGSLDKATGCNCVGICIGWMFAIMAVSETATGAAMMDLSTYSATIPSDGVF